MCPHAKLPMVSEEVTGCFHNCTNDKISSQSVMFPKQCHTGGIKLTILACLLNATQSTDLLIITHDTAKRETNVPLGLMHNP